MSEISKRIIEAVKAHMNEYGGLDDEVDLHISMESDLETRIDAILLDAVFPIKETAE